MDKNYYNINNLMTFSIQGTKSKLDYINRQYSYFLSNKAIEDVDIEVFVGKFNEVSFLKNYEVVNRKYKVCKDCIFAEDSYKVAKWKFMIKDLYKKKTIIYFDGNYWGYYILYKFFIEPVIRFKLNAKGYFMIHASSVCADGKAFVFPASPSVGKTSTMMNWLHGGKAFIADEYTIISNSTVYSYPTPLRLHDYNLKANPYICKDMCFHDKLQIYLRTWIFRLTLGYGDVTHEVDIWNIFKNVNIINKTELGRVVIFTKYSGKNVRKKIISKKQFIEKLLTIDRFESTRFNEYLDAYYYINNINADEQFWNKMRNNISNIFSDSEYMELNIPTHYTEKHLTKLTKSWGIKSLMKNKKDFFWNILGSTMYGFSSMFLIVGINYICGAYVSGIFSVVFMTAQMLMYLGNYGVRVYQASDISEKYSFSDYLWHRVLTCIIMMIASIVFAWIRRYNNEMAVIVISVTAYKMLDAFSDCFEGRLQQKDMFYLSCKSLFYRTLISSMFLLICLYITKNLLYSCIITVIIAVILCIVFSVYPVIKYSCISTKKMQLKKSSLGLFFECFPLFSSLFMLAYIVNSPKYAIENNLPYEMQTYFNAFYFPAQVIYLITSFAFKPLIFSMAQYWNDIDEHYKIKSLINKLICGILVFMLGAVAVAFLIGIPVLNSLFQLDFSDFRIEMIIMLVGGAGIAIINMIYNVLTVMRCKKCIFVSYAFVFIISIILPNIFVRKFNLLGAILSYDILMYLLATILLYFFSLYIKK